MGPRGAFLCLVVGACSVLTDTDGLVEGVSGPDSATTSDGGEGETSTADGSPGEALDAGFPDASSKDVTNDAPVDAPCVGWCRCRPQATGFCDDFDDLALEAGDGWSEIQAGADASVGLVTTDLVSPTRSVQFMTPQNNVAQDEALLVQKNVGTLEPGMTVRVSFDAKVDFSSGLCANEDAYLATIGLRELSVAIEEVQFRLDTRVPSDATSLVVSQSSSFPTEARFSAPRPNPIHQKWARVTLEASLAPRDGGHDLLGRLFVGVAGAYDAGTLVAEESVHHLDSMKFVDVTFGLRRTYQSVPCRVLIDNVTISVD